jgi:ferredoxin
MALLLFCTSRFNEQKCSTCGSCALDCPTRAIQINDYVDSRVFRYTHYHCIACLAFVKTCREESVELKHRIDFRLLLQTASKEKRRVDLVRCKKCKLPFEPVSQAERVESSVNHDQVYVCPRYKKVTSEEIIYLLPLLKKTFP